MAIEIKGGAPPPPLRADPGTSGTEAAEKPDADPGPGIAGQGVGAVARPEGTAQAREKTGRRPTQTLLSDGGKLPYEEALRRGYAIVQTADGKAYAVGPHEIFTGIEPALIARPQDILKGNDLELYNQLVAKYGMGNPQLNFLLRGFIDKALAKRAQETGFSVPDWPGDSLGKSLGRDRKTLGAILSGEIGKNQLGPLVKQYEARQDAHQRASTMMA